MKPINTSSLRKNITVYISIAMLVLLIVTMAITMFSQKHHIKQQEKEYHMHLHKSIKHTISHYFNSYANRTKQIIKTTSLIQMFQQKDRDGIYKLLKPKWDLMQKEEPSLTAINLYLSDGSFFLCMSRHDTHDCNHEYIKPIQKEICGTHKAINSHDAGNNGAVYMIAAPILNDKNKCIGIFEMQLDTSIILNSVNNIFNTKKMIFIKNDEVRTGDLSIDGYKLQSKPDAELKSIANALSAINILEDDIKISTNGKRYAAHLFVLNDFMRQPKVKILFFEEDTKLCRFPSCPIDLLPIVILILFALLLWLIYKLINKYENKVAQLYHEQMTQLDKSEHLLAKSQKIAHIGSWEFDIVSNKLSWSDEIYHIFEVDKNNFIPSYDAFLNAIHPDDREIVDLAYNDSLKNKKPYNITHRLLMEDGCIKFVRERCKTIFDKNGKPLVSIGTVQDVTKQKHLQNKLELNRKYLQNIFNMTPNIMVTTNGEEIDDANHAMLKFTGFKTIEDFKSKHKCICDLFVEEDNYLQAKMNGTRWLDYILSRPSMTHEVLMMKNGKRHHFIVRAKSLEGDDKHRKVVVFNDVTKLEEIKERFEYAINGANDGLWDWNLENGEIYFATPWKKMLGYESNEIINTPNEWFDRIHPDDLEQNYKDIYASQSKPNIPYQNIYRMHNKDGKWIWILNRGQTIFDKNGEAVRMTGYQTDISELQNLGEQLSKTHKTLLENEKKLQAIIESAQDAIIMLDNKGRFVFWNNYAKEMLGYSEEELKGKDFHKIIAPKAYHDSAKKGYKKFAATGEGDAIRKTLELSAIRKDGVEFPISLSLNGVQIEDQWHGIGFMRDITEEQKMKKELKHKEEMMISQSRHAAMGEMISMIAHQWRQPISVMAMGANNILANIELDTLDNETLQEEAKEIIDQTQELSKTIDDFRNFFMPQKKAEKVLIDDIINEVFSVVGKSLENNDIEVVKKLNNSKKIKTYSRELMQVIINLIKNAKEALVESNADQRKIVISTLSDSDMAIIKICDNGGGIKEDVIDKIFDPYFSTKEEKSGTGLGLYMSKTIIEKHLNGKLKAYNNNVGACFEIIMPYTIEQ